MDRRELINDPEEALRAAFGSFQAGLWCALPGIIQSFNAVAMTVVVQPALRAKVRRPNGDIVSVVLPLLVDVPVVFQGGGGFTLTFPVAAGDECLVVFADRCIDAWWQSGGVQAPLEPRMHDLSDGFALVGVRSQPRVLPSVSTTTTQLRSDDGSTFVEVAGGQVVTVKAPSKVVLDTPIVETTGVLRVMNTQGFDNACTITGTLTTSGDVEASGISLMNHVHTGVQPGGGNTGGPV